MRRICVILLFMLLWSCGGRSPQEGQEGKLTVYVSIAPYAGIVKEIAGSHVDVHVLVGEGQDPHTYETTPQQVMRLGDAGVLFTGGLPFEHRIVEKLKDNGPRIVDVTAGISKRRMASELDEAGHHHDHEHDHDHDHGHDHADALDPHVWLSPPLIKDVARNVAKTLKDVDPARAKEYEANLKDFLARVDQVHKNVKAVLAPYKGREFFVYHPAFGYFAEAYGLKQVPVELEGKSPSPKHLRALIQRARKRGVRVVFVQPQFSKESAQAIADAIDGAVVPLDTLERDVLANLERMAQRVREAIEKETAQ